MLVASLLLVVRMLLVAMPGAPSSFLLLVVRPGAPSSVFPTISSMSPPSYPLISFGGCIEELEKSTPSDAKLIVQYF